MQSSSPSRIRSDYIIKYEFMNRSISKIATSKIAKKIKGTETAFCILEPVIGLSVWITVLMV